MKKRCARCKHCLNEVEINDDCEVNVTYYCGHEDSDLYGFPIIPDEDCCVWFEVQRDDR